MIAPLADLWEALPLPALALDAEGRLAALNGAAEEWLNLSRRAALGQSAAALARDARLTVEPPLTDLARRAAEGHDAIIHPAARITLGARSAAPVTRRAAIHAAPAPSGGLSVVLVPEEPFRDAPARAARGAARAATGMAEMLAHEIKNPLAGIRGAAQLLAMELPEGRGDLADLTELIVAESRRIVALLDQVERFGDTSPPALAAVNLHDVLERARLSAELSFARAVRIVPDYDPSLPPVAADPDQLMQLVLNLMRNAAEALDRTRGGTIRLRSFYDGALRLSDPARPLPIHLEVEDNGPGLPEDIAERIFEPFISGRENGTGLGLALVAKIAADHGAWVGVDSRPGRTVFRLSLAKA
ncbi:PAS domain-containing protein [Paracoccus sp. S-4012]|uniref:two-component system sensor histidine kinase NtrB n=1 Tax=Paracoccus sp. S-4012 TaxID=2665648 RepID=UPI0012AFFD6B|nr:ATP-binding protein [Paracoccus sp. S-4012]MRX51540.1 PAS domain-containing protein [Paracoccus sp. S-4012]